MLAPYLQRHRGAWTHVSHAFHRISTDFLAVFHRFDQETFPRKRFYIRVSAYAQFGFRALEPASHGFHRYATRSTAFAAVDRIAA